MLDSNLTSKPDQVDESHPVQITFPSEVVFNDGEKQINQKSEKFILENEDPDNQKLDLIHAQDIFSDYPNPEDSLARNFDTFTNPEIQSSVNPSVDLSNPHSVIPSQNIN